MIAHRKALIRLLGALVLALSFGAAAQTSPADNAHNSDAMGSMHGGSMHGMHAGMMGMHAMQAVVTTVDKQSGLVGVTAGGMALTVHFPPSSVANLNAGDKITLHMGYSKP